MIRPFTCLCLLAAGGSGLYLYSEKHRTTLLDREIARVIHATEAERAHCGLLRAEWALLNEPERLRDMSGRYLDLHPLAPTQFVQTADLAGHLPGTAAASPAGADDDDAPAPADAAAPAVVASMAAPDAPQAAPAGADAAVQPPLPAHHPLQPAIRPDAHAGLKLARADVRRPPHHAMPADRPDGGLHDSPVIRGIPLPLAAPQPVGASVYNAMARPMRAPPAHQAVVAASPSYSVASALGNTASLPPPVPYGR